MQARSRIPVVFTLEGIGKAYGTLQKMLAPLTVEEIRRNLPLEGRASLWGDEVYFQVPIKRGEEKARSHVDEGSIAYWPMGNALCIFFAPSKPYSPVNLLGRIERGLELFRKVESGTRIGVTEVKPKGPKR
ncbi:MAG: cyclophilin-like fold protein [Candidatus Bathyarchaeia archaeon]